MLVELVVWLEASNRDMASFGFLAPVFGVMLGWLLLGEELSIWIIFALVLVSCGIVLINRKSKETLAQ